MLIQEGMTSQLQVLDMPINKPFKLHWSTKILAHEEKCLFLMYFWMLNSNMFPEFLYHPHLLLQIKGLKSSVPEHLDVFLPWLP